MAFTWLTAFVRITPRGTGRDRTYVAAVVDAADETFERRDFVNPVSCEEWAASWGLPIEGSTWEGQ